MKSSPKGLKTWWEKEKYLVMSNFSYPQRVFKRLALQIPENQGLFGKELIMLSGKESRNQKLKQLRNATCIIVT